MQLWITASTTVDDALAAVEALWRARLRALESSLLAQDFDVDDVDALLAEQQGVMQQWLVDHRGDVEALVRDTHVELRRRSGDV